MIKFNSAETNLWWSSDLHINHINICKSTTSWTDSNRTRDFKSINQMNETIFNNINSLIKPDDHLFLLGDLLFRFKRPEDYWKFFDRINCNNIYIIYGNHDWIDSLLDLYNYPDRRTGMRIIHPKLKFQGYYLEILVNGRLICMSHYAFRVWNKSHHGSWMLYGHSHSTLPSQGKQLDVGIDSYYNMFGEYKPFSYNKINKFMEHQPLWLEDHHNKNTN